MPITSYQHYSYCLEIWTSYFTMVKHYHVQLSLPQVIHKVCYEPLEIQKVERL